MSSIAIIGAGIAGLSAGIYGRLNGFETTIYESNPHPGGVCTSWERNGYLVNGSIHWLVGSGPGSGLYDIWRQLGVIENNTFYQHGVFASFRDIDGVDVHIYTDVDRLEAHFLEIAPQDEEIIREMTRAIRVFADAEFPFDKPFEMFHLLDWGRLILGNFPALRAMGKYSKITMGEFAQRFHSPVLRQVIEGFWSPEMTMTFFFIQMAYAHNGAAGYPLGGSGAFTRRLETRYTELGGQFQFNTRIQKVRVEHGRAVGVETEDGSFHPADYVISACDGMTTLDKLLPQGVVDARTRDAYQVLEPFPAIIYFSAGVRQTFPDLPATMAGTNIPLPEPLQVGSYRHSRAAFQIFHFDPTLAPEGCTLITAMLDTDHDFWQSLHDRDQAAYLQERERIARALILALDQAFPGLQEKVDFTDTATPVTFAKWTGNYKGSYEGWLPTPAASKVMLPQHFPDLSHFYMAGHWVVPGGGMPPAAQTGRNAIQLICRAEKQVFQVHE